MAGRTKRRNEKVVAVPRPKSTKPLPAFVLDGQDKVHKRASLRRAKCGYVLTGVWWAEDWLPENYPHCLTCMSMTSRTVITITKPTKGGSIRALGGGLPELGKR